MADAKTHDLIIIGAGPGGYVAAIRAAQLGFDVAVVEKRTGLGGTCLNVGCIPSKALLDSTELYHQAAHKFEVHGLITEGLSFDLCRMMKRKDQVVNNTLAGIDYLFEKNKISRYRGVGSFVDARTIRVSGDDRETLQADHVIVATGSEPAALAAAPIDGERIITSTEALSLPAVPEHLIVIGGGAIGLELGSVYGRLGAKVTVVEFMDAIVPNMDADLSKALQRALKKIGMAFHLQTKVTATRVDGQRVHVTAESAKGKTVELVGDRVLVAVGRRPHTDGLDCAAAGVEVDERGHIRTDANLRTTAANVFAIGDVVVGPMLAHKAEEEGVAVVERLAGQQPFVDHSLIPGVVYTWPEVAAVGRTEAELAAQNVAYKVGSFPFKASGRARAAEESDGFVKVLADAATDAVLGVHMIGPRCADLIAEAVVAMTYQASAEDIARICHPHPTFSEALKEAALMATEDRAIHL